MSRNESGSQEEVSSGEKDGDGSLLGTISLTLTDLVVPNVAGDTQFPLAIPQP